MSFYIIFLSEDFYIFDFPDEKKPSKNELWLLGVIL
jgi:hypothetical protein